MLPRLLLLAGLAACASTTAPAAAPAPPVAADPLPSNDAPPVPPAPPAPPEVTLTIKGAAARQPPPMVTLTVEGTPRAGVPFAVRIDVTAPDDTQMAAEHAGAELTPNMVALGVTPPEGGAVRARQESGGLPGPSYRKKLDGSLFRPAELAGKHAWFDLEVTAPDAGDLAMRADLLVTYCPPGRCLTPEVWSLSWTQPIAE